MKIPSGISNKLGRPMLKLQKISPQLMFGAGVVGVVGAGVMACRSTLKLDAVLEDAEKRSQLLELESEHNPEIDGPAHARLVVANRVRTLVSIAKLYAPAVGVAAVSIGLLTGSHVTLTRRNAATMAAYSALDQAYRKYQERVEEKYGAEEADQLRQGVVTVEETVVKEDGKTKVVKHARSAGRSPYARLFTEGNKNWSPTPHTNWFFLNSQRNYLNDQLQSRGHVFLNDVYDALGMERSSAGAVVGWVIGEQGRDGYIDFGISDERSEAVRDFMTGAEGSICLDFNVDGVVYDKI